jgi:hypothetical protein
VEKGAAGCHHIKHVTGAQPVGGVAGLPTVTAGRRSQIE